MLKNVAQLVHTRHRSVHNFLMNMLAAMGAYCFFAVKPEVNSIYNTFIETCKQTGVSFRDYFCRLLRELKEGRTDYENLLPMTICK